MSQHYIFKTKNNTNKIKTQKQSKEYFFCFILFFRKKPKLNASVLYFVCGISIKKKPK